MVKKLLITLIAVAVLAPASADAATKDCFKPIIHRGVHGANVDENTLLSIKRAKGKGAAEIDIRLTKDHRIVLMHNAKVNSTTDGTGYMRNLTWKQVRKLRTKNGYRVPSFRQAVRVASRNRVVLVAELKSYNDWTPRLIRLATRISLKSNRRVYLGGRGYGFLNNIPANAAPGTNIYWRPTHGTPATPANVRSHHAKMVMVRSQTTNRKQIRRLNRNGFVTALRKTDNFQRAKYLGVDYALTNHYRRAIKFCR